MKDQYKNRVHRILVRSYYFYFTFFILGILLDFFFPLKVFSGIFFQITGISFLLLASILVFWAQRSSARTGKEINEEKNFFRGPYRFTRTPTHLSLFLLTVGFAFLTDAASVFLTSLLSLIITKTYHLRREEKILVKKYGEAYEQYKKSVKF